MCSATQPPKGLLTAPLMTVQDIQASNLRLEVAPDGGRYIALRIHVEGASAVRLYITNMSLSTGQTLTLSNASGTQISGPFTFAGPTHSGEFLTDVINGPEVVVELQTGPEGVADLPFKIRSIEAAEQSPAVEDVIGTEERQTVESIYRGIPLTHEVVNGMAIFEGDILLGPAHELTRAAGFGPKARERSSVGIAGQSYRWPNGILPYVLSSALPNQARITAAVEHWNSVMADMVKLTPRTRETSYVEFVRDANPGTCASYVGKNFNGRHTIQVGDYCSSGNMIHEIGHAFGLWHEHTREDRNQYVSVNMANVLSGMSHNFTQNITNGDDLGSYDYGSVMHYYENAFSANGLPTIVTIPAGVQIGQRNGLSTGDIAGIKALYKPAVTTTSTVTYVYVTITANPVGAPFMVDGLKYTASITLRWMPNSYHMLSAPNTSTATMRTTFVRWSDSGAQSHYITANANVTAYKVDYAVAHPIMVSATTPGTATVEPASADTFYDFGTTVSLNAVAPADYCFSGWKGLVSDTPPATSLVANQAYAVEASFQSGAITLGQVSVSSAGVGGTYSVDVSANSGCVWSAQSDVPWIHSTTSTAASGPGIASFTVDPNESGLTRSGVVTIGGQMLSVVQSAI